MKNRNPLIKVALLLAVLLSLGVARMQGDILPTVSIGFAPVGLTLDQTARLNLVNVSAPNGMMITWRFLDASGAKLAESTVILSYGKIVSVDYKRAEPPGESPGPLRAEVRAQVDILTGGISSDSLRRSLEVFNNSTGATTVYMGGS